MGGLVALGGLQWCWWLVVCANFSAFRLVDLLAFRLVGKLESWRGGSGRVGVMNRNDKAGCARGGRKRSERPKQHGPARCGGGEIQGVSPGGLGRPAPDVGLVVYPKGKTAGAR